MDEKKARGMSGGFSFFPSEDGGSGEQYVPIIDNIIYRAQKDVAQTIWSVVLFAADEKEQEIAPEKIAAMKAKMEEKREKIYTQRNTFLGRLRAAEGGSRSNEVRNAINLLHCLEDLTKKALANEVLTTLTDQAEAVFLSLPDLHTQRLLTDRMVSCARDFVRLAGIVSDAYGSWSSKLGQAVGEEPHALRELNKTLELFNQFIGTRSEIQPSNPMCAPEIVTEMFRLRTFYRRLCREMAHILTVMDQAVINIVQNGDPDVEKDSYELYRRVPTPAPAAAPTAAPFMPH